MFPDWKQKSSFLLELLCECVHVCVGAQAGLRIPICVSVLQSGIDFRENLTEVM